MEIVSEQEREIQCLKSKLAELEKENILNEELIIQELQQENTSLRKQIDNLVHKSIELRELKTLKQQLSDLRRTHEQLTEANWILNQNMESMKGEIEKLDSMGNSTLTRTHWSEFGGASKVSRSLRDSRSENESHAPNLVDSRYTSQIIDDDGREFEIDEIGCCHSKSVEKSEVVESTNLNVINNSKNEEWQKYKVYHGISRYGNSFV